MFNFMHTRTQSFTQMMNVRSYAGERLEVAERNQLAKSRMPQKLVMAPEGFTLDAFEKASLPGVYAIVTQVAIDSVSPRFIWGRVASFDVTPHKFLDPVLVVTKHMDLGDYYLVWGALVKALPSEVMNLIDLYDLAIGKAVRSAEDLTRQEVHFAMFEFLNFRNNALKRAPR